MPATVGVPSPQPPMASVGVDVGDRRQRVGVSESCQHELAGVLGPQRAVKLSVEPVTGRSVTVAVPVKVTAEPPASVTLMMVA